MPAGAIPIRVLSLQRTADRRAAFSRHNAHLGFSWFDAIDGKGIPRDDLAGMALFAPSVGETYTAGAIGCALSHRALWQEAVATGAALTLVEDDAILRGDFAAASQAVLGSLPADWDFVLWGWNFDSSLVLQAVPGVSAAALLFDQRRMRGALETFQQLRDPVLPLRLHACFGIPAYTVSARGAERLLSLCFPLTELLLRVPLIHADVTNTGIDVAMNVAYPNLSAWACFPPLAVTPNDIDRSTVQDRPVAQGLR